MKLIKLKASNGFTLVEIMVVIAITVLLSSIAITYNRSGERQIVLFRDQALVVGLLNRTKSLAIQKYRDPDISGDYSTCAFGLHFESGSRDFILFQDFGEGGCSLANYAYGPTDPTATPPPPLEELESFSLDSKLEFSGIPIGGLDILFVPPELTATTTHASGFPVTITIQTVGGGSTVPITVFSIAGQIITD
ncbi:MAG: prepilin-type N-terminal cleavage/methylation domain-containing protein [Patescibacteria group bacterium]|nr:prepilin-type N-terminal cleavage/methylation domain-containing protein [Patescibacteria group bacterium]